MEGWTSNRVRIGDGKGSAFKTPGTPRIAHHGVQSTWGGGTWSVRPGFVFASILPHTGSNLLLIWVFRASSLYRYFHSNIHRATCV